MEISESFINAVERRKMIFTLKVHVKMPQTMSCISHYVRYKNSVAQIPSENLHLNVFYEMSVKIKD